MAWRLAKSLETLRAQVDTRWPGRDRTSDGTIGDAAHASRTSDHNSWIKDRPGPDVVSAWDCDRDLGKGTVVRMIAEALVKSRDPRIKYIISDGQMCRSYPKGNLPAWSWGPYTGTNAHRQHMHISVNEEKKYYDDTSAWSLDGVQVADGLPVVPPPRRVLKLGSAGSDVKELQTKLGIKVDGDFGPLTRKAVIEFQISKKLVADGIVGPQTFAAL